MPHQEMTSLYYGRDMQDVIFKPMNSLSRFSKDWVAHPLSMFNKTQMARLTVAQLELAERLTNRYNKPDWRFKTITARDGTVYKIDPHIVLRKSFCNLVHFKREMIDTTPKRNKRRRENLPKVLIVAPYSGHYATLLRDTVSAMLIDHDVYVTDWDNARDVPIYKGLFTLDTYIDYLLEFVKTLDTDLHVMAVCQPAVPVIALTALLASDNSSHQPKSVTLIGGPIDARRADTGMSQLSQKHSIEWFERVVVGYVPHYYPGALRRVVPGFIMLAGFMYLNLDKHVLAPQEFFNHLIQGDAESAHVHRAFYDEYRSVLDLPADYFLDSVQAVFQEHLLPRGLMRWRDEMIDLKAIHKTALMTIEGGRDDISGVGPTYAAQDLCTNIPAQNRCHHLQPEVGHYGVFNGRRWRDIIQPKIADFIRAHQ